MSRRAVVRPLDLPQGRRVLVVSDIHGALPLLQGALRKANFSQEDILIVLGDMMERSVTSLDTLRFVMELSKTHEVHTVLGNCDNVTLAFFDREEKLPEDFYAGWIPRYGQKCVLAKMAHLAGIALDSPQDYPKARRVLAEKFAPELDFLRSLPHILLHEDYLFVHGGVPREENLEELDSFHCMKNDDFMRGGYSFHRWVIVGHTPVTLYHEHRPSAAPLVDRKSHIVSIDGGATIKQDGQVNLLILPRWPGGEFTWVSEDGLDKVTALEGQEPSVTSRNIHFGDNRVEVLARGEEFSRCRQVSTGCEMDILTEFLYEGRDGQTYTQDATDHILPVSPGDILSVVRRTSRGLLAKKDSVTGWYFGSWQD